MDERLQRPHVVYRSLRDCRRMRVIVETAAVGVILWGGVENSLRTMGMPKLEGVLSVIVVAKTLVLRQAAMRSRRVTRPRRIKERQGEVRP